MSSFFETALDLARRGFHVFPLKPRDKSPIVAGGFKAATRDPEQIALWWKRNPDANIGIACEASGLCVVDCDHGLTSWDDFQAWRIRNGLPETFTVRSGRRPEFGVQMYYRGPISTSRWELDGCSGDIKSIGGLVVASPSVHPSGERYQVLADLAIVPTPDVVKQLKKVLEQKAQAPDGLITENRNQALVSRIGKFRVAIPGVSEESTLAFMQQWNLEECAEPMSCDEVEETTRKQFRLYPDAVELPKITLGTPEEKKVITDWRERYHTKDEMENAPKPTFLIDGFLQKDVIASIAAPVGQRKTLIAVNVAHSLVKGAALFDHFAVTQKPTRVLYLCPEMGLISFTDRLRKLGLMEYVGKTLFCRTMNSEGTLTLAELTAEELAGACVIIDTAVRFIQGDEDSSEHMRAFAEECFRLMKSGAASVLVLFHSPKATKQLSELTLENAMRGSGELGAFVSSCWATRLQNPDEPYQSASYLTNVKQRDFESKPFEVMSSKDCRLHIVDAPNTGVKLSSKKPGAQSDADGREADALRVIRDNLDLSLDKIVTKLSDVGIERKRTWVSQKRCEIRGTGVTLSVRP
jgi:Bifunctional DNA primase/polymerase, N-terminal/AAA domain